MGCQHSSWPPKPWQGFHFKFRICCSNRGGHFFHVHHVIPLHTIKDSYVIDPEQDLVPLCPNCHSMVHQRNPPLSVEELRSKIMPRYIALFR
nr:HNH endonuclease [Methylomonas koyamae]